MTGQTLEEAMNEVGESAPSLGPLDHLGIVATDIRSAMKSMAALLGQPWTQPLVDAQRTYLIGGEAVHVTMNVGYIGAPTPLEFVGALDGTVWEPRDQPYLHHLAYRVSDFQGVCAHLRDCGAKLALTLPTEGDLPSGVAYFEYRGLILEILDGTP